MNATNPLTRDLSLAGHALVGGTLQRPDGTTFAAFDADGTTLLYYPDGITLAVQFDNGAFPIKFYDPDGRVWLQYHDGVFSFEGNNPFVFAQGGVDANGYQVNHVADPRADDDAATKAYVDAAIAAALGTP